MQCSAWAVLWRGFGVVVGVIERAFLGGSRSRAPSGCQRHVVQVLGPWAEHLTPEPDIDGIRQRSNRHLYLTHRTAITLRATTRSEATRSFAAVSRACADVDDRTLEVRRPHPGAPLRARRLRVALVGWDDFGHVVPTALDEALS